MPETQVGVAVSAAVRAADERLEKAGCETPQLDAEVLLSWVLGVGRERLVLDAESPLDNAALARYGEAVARRAAREPVAYITGIKEFRRIALAVDRRVLIPRPETELLVEVGLTLPHAARVVDVGTGSGAVALALKQERPDLSMLGADIDPDAVEVARGNGERLGLEVEFQQADLLAGVGQDFDAVLANLPYVAADFAELPPEISGYEPPRALFGGTDGLDLIRRLTVSAADVPLLALEVGFDQGDAVSAMLRDVGFQSVERLRDLAGHERVVVGRR